VKSENARLNPDGSDSSNVGLVSAWKANAHVSLGAVNALLGVDEVNVPLSLYEIVLA